MEEKETGRALKGASGDGSRYDLRVDFGAPE
jgi:hypothetical protein